MNGDAAGYIGSIPQDYDRSLGPLIFADYAADISHRVAACNPARVLETAAGTGIVTRRLRDVLPVSVRLTATDLNPPMLEIARTKFRAGEQVDFQPADATELPFADSSFDVVVCQFGVMFFPDKDKPIARFIASLPTGATTYSTSGIRIATTRLAELRTKSQKVFSLPIRLNSKACRSPRGSD
jgi:ubiquinone/menaquinone biosynthesis C-methylase UbiE